MFGPSTRPVEREPAEEATKPTRAQVKDTTNQLTPEEQEFYGETPEESQVGYPTRYPRKAKNVRVGQTLEDDESYDSNEDEDMFYHEEWIEPHQDFAPKHFEGIPEEWHETIKIKNPHTQRVKLFFKCKYPGCTSTFKKSCNLRDHFRKHTGLRPFSCPKCHKTFT